MTELQRTDVLAILLEYAYRGVAAQGGRYSCHNDRFDGCVLCDALSAAEEELRAEDGEYILDTEWWTEWWVRPWYRAAWDWLEWRFMRVRWWVRKKK